MEPREPRLRRDGGDGRGGEGAVRDAVLALCREILGPLVSADGGRMYLVDATADVVHLHLSGACSGCPGVSFTREKVIAPLIEAAAPKARLVVTTGIHPPEGASKID